MESRQVLSATDLFNSAVPLVLNGDQPQIGTIGESPKYYSFSVMSDGRLTVDLEPTTGAARLTLLSSTGEVLVQSDVTSPHHANERIDLHLLGSAQGIAYYLRVEALGHNTGSYLLNADYSATTRPFLAMPVGTEPWSSVATDLNADGIVDLAVANFDSSDMSIYLGQGDGTFAPPALFGIGSGANFVVAGDFNSDGQLDLATANMNSSTVSILPGNGDGTFQTSTEYFAGDTASGLTTGDFNRDGALDLAVAAYGANAVTILLNDGTGSFAEPIEYAVGANPYLITSGDFNGDGLTDLATPNYFSNDVSILLGQGDGTFTFAPMITAGEQPYAPIARDFNGDGKLDLAVTNYTSNDVSLFLGNGDGTFATQTLVVAGTGPTAIEVADFDSDGHLDFIAANLSDATLSLLLGHGDGTFESQRKLAAGTSPSSVTVADFNRDGLLDVGFTDLTSNDVRVLLGRGNASFLTEPAQSSATKVFQVVAADFNGDGRLDLASANYSTSDASILLGNQDGTFQFGGRFTVGSDLTAIGAGDVNRDGFQDLITCNYGTADISVLLGAGDGTFGEPAFFHAGVIPYGLVVADFNDDDRLDVVTVNSGDASVSLLIGDSNGQFAEPLDYLVGAGANQITAGDFNEDGQLDLAVTNRDDNNVSILLNVGGGQFAPQFLLDLEMGPRGVTVGDFNNDGALDLAVANFGSASVSLFFGDSAGHFADPFVLTTEDAPELVLAGDFNHDHLLDLATVDRGSNSVTIHAGHGDGSFHLLANIPLQGLSYQLVLGDFNGDGNGDLATASEGSNVSVLLGHTDGTFDLPIPTVVAGGPAAIASADFNSDGNLDLVTVNPTTQALSVGLGRGDGTTLAPIVTSLEGEPVAVVTEDFNNDGRPDVAIASYLANSVSILLGIGDGTFQSPMTLSVGAHPVALVTGDFNHDGLADLATSDFGGGTVSVLMGRAEGAFAEARTFQVGEGPVALAVSDLNLDGQFDLVVSNGWSRDLTLLIGGGDGSFHSAATLALGATPGTVSTGDLNNDGRVDIAATHPALNTVAILLGGNDGAFQSPEEFVVGAGPESLTIVDFNGDGRADIATTNSNSHDVTVLLGSGDGTFPSHTAFDVGRFPSALLAGDFNNDDRFDLATANGLGEPVSVKLGLSNGLFTQPGASSPIIQSRPLVADFSGDGILDVALLRNDGVLLFRAGSPGGIFQAPVIINTEKDDSFRDLAVVTSQGRSLIVAINIQSNTIDVVAAINGQFLKIVDELPVAGILLSRILTGDLNGDGLDDAVMASAASGRVFVYLQRPRDVAEGRPPTYQIDVGNGITDMALVDVNGDGLPEIVVTDRVSGDIRVLLNSAETPFANQLRYRAGTGLTNVVQVDGSLQVQSRDAPVAVVSGLFNDDAIPDLAVLNQGTNRVDLLLGNGDGGFTNATPESSFPTGLDPVSLVTADFNGDGRPDLAVLNQGSNDLSIFLNGGNSRFTEHFATNTNGRAVRSNAGNYSTGLSVGDIDGDKSLDLLLGNQQGDVLTLLGNGDGTFRPYQRIDRHVGLAISGLNNKQGPAIAVFDQSLDRVTYQSNSNGSTFQQGREDGLLAPNAVTFSDLNADGIDDMIVASGGSNEVFVYLGLHDNRFGIGQRYFVGTDPEAITISDLNADGVPDLLVTNHGSNDLSLLFGQGHGNDWALIAGPRLRAGSGPIATVVSDLNADGVADILVANHDSNDVSLLVGLGRGFFSDKQPITHSTGRGPVELFVGYFEGDGNLNVVTVNEGSRDLTVRSCFCMTGLSSVRTVNLNGLDPVAAIAQDFNHDGLSDLIVADESGRFALWLGGSSEVRAIQTQGSLSVANLSELVLGRVTSNSVEIYFTSAGSTAATLATFSLSFDSAPTTVPVVLPMYAPVPFAQAVSFRQEFATSFFTTTNDEFGNLNSFNRETDYSSLPMTMFNTEFTNSELGVAVAEFSSPSGSSLEVITTLVLGFRESSATAATEDDSDSDGMTGTESHSLATERDLLLTGAMETPIQQHLKERTATETAAGILFSSPLDWFDVSHQTAVERPSREVSKEAQIDAFKPDAADQSEQSEHPQSPVRKTTNPQRAEQPLRNDERDRDLSFDDRKSTSDSSVSVCVLVIGIAAVAPLEQDHSHVCQNVGRSRIAPVSDEICYSKKKS